LPDRAAGQASASASAERALAPVDEGGAHPVGLGADAVEGVIGDEEDAGSILAKDLLRFRVRLPVRLEVTRLLHRDYMVEGKADVGASRLQHVAIAVRQDRELVARMAQPAERRDHIGKRLQLLDLGDQPADLVLRIGDPAAVQT
jgi:hypothetical protein